MKAGGRVRIENRKSTNQKSSIALAIAGEGGLDIGSGPCFLELFIDLARFVSLALLRQSVSQAE